MEMIKARKKSGPKVQEGTGPHRRRSVSMSDIHWEVLEGIAAEKGLRSASALVCKWIEAQPLFSMMMERDWELGVPGD